MRKPSVRLEGRCHSPVIHDSVGRKSLCKSHLRLKVGKVVWLLERERVRECRCQHLIERQRIAKGLFRAHAKTVFDRNLVVLVDEVIAVEIVEGYGSGGIYCSRSHSVNFVSWCDRRGEKNTDGLG